MCRGCVTQHNSSHKEFLALIPASAICDQATIATLLPHDPIFAQRMVASRSFPAASFQFLRKWWPYLFQDALFTGASLAVVVSILCQAAFVMWSASHDVCTHVIVSIIFPKADRATLRAISDLKCCGGAGHMSHRSALLGADTPSYSAAVSGTISRTTHPFCLSLFLCSRRFCS